MGFNLKMAHLSTTPLAWTTFNTNSQMDDIKKCSVKVEIRPETTIHTLIINTRKFSSSTHSFHRFLIASDIEQ